MPSAVVLVVDGLGAKFLGPYGNTWIDTPAFNRIASQALLLQNVFSPGGLEEACRSLWQAGPKSDVSDGLLARLEQQGIATSLITDAPWINEAPEADWFQERDEVAAPRGLTLADDWKDTHTAQFFAQAIARVDSLAHDALLWIHFAGLANPWDAPFPFRDQFADDEDPEPSTSAQVPSLTLDAGFDPDALHEIRCALAGQIVLVDRCFEVLLSVFEDLAKRQEVLLVLAAPRGFPMGEHGVVGWRGATMHHELLHVPALLRFPARDFAMQRWMGLAETADLAEYLWQWFSRRRITPIDRDYSMLRHGDELLLRTSCWRRRYAHVDRDLVSGELYLQPDDQQEINNVADRCDEVELACRQLAEDWLHHQGDPIVVPNVLRVPIR